MTGAGNGTLQVLPRLDGTLLVSGELDMAQAIRFTAAVVSELDHQDEVVLDMSGVTFLDSWGLRAIFQLPTTLGVSVVLRDAEGGPSQLLDIASIDAPSGITIKPSAAGR